MQPSVTPSPTRAPMVVAGLASIGAGATHAVAAGAHSEHSQAVAAFVALSVVQIGWGLSVLRGADRIRAAAGVALSAAAIGGWVVAKTVGIGAIDGLGGAEAVQTADALAAGLAAVALVGCVLRLLGQPAVPARLAPVVATAMVAVAIPAMVAAGSHQHDHGDGHAHDASHDHGDDVADQPHPGGGELAAADHGGEGHDHAVPVPPEPFHPDLPIDLSGVEGVTPQQQARAENLLAVTLYRLPRYADPAVAEADGFHSIGDGLTGYEHYVNWDYVNDDKILDPDHPESLVYQVIDGRKQLVAAMYMLPDGETLDSVPDIGGPLTQWHIHDDLCFTPDPVAPRVAGLTDAEGNCRAGLVKGNENPMIHVWIVPHECGPFAALEGVAGGQIADGEQRWCDHAHGTG